jgi:hypothetical protein
MDEPRVPDRLLEGSRNRERKQRLTTTDADCSRLSIPVARRWARQTLATTRTRRSLNHG